MSILRSQMKRIWSNYARLLLGFFIGIFTVRVLIGYGQDVFNIYTLIAVGAGVGIMLKELMRIALIPHLSRAWADNCTVVGIKANFADVYAASFRTSTLAVALGLLLMVGVGLFFHRLNVSAVNMSAAYVFLGCRAAIMVMTVGLSPLTSMMPVKMQFNRWNGLQTAERIADLISVAMPMLLGITSESYALKIFGVSSVFFYAILYYLITRVQVREDVVLNPCWRGSEQGVLIRAILTSMGWTAALVLSFNLYLRFDTFFINIHFGASETVAFGICVQVVGMVRQVTAGLVFGLDAVAAKAHFNAVEPTTRSKDRASRFAAAELVRHATYLQTTITFSAFVFLWFHGTDVINLWFTGQSMSPGVLDLAARLSVIMLLGIAMMSISDPWMNALNGIGEISSYVRFTFPLAIMNPVLLLSAAALFGRELNVEIVGAAFTLLLALSYLLIVPTIFARESGQPLSKVLFLVARGMAAPLLILLVLKFAPLSPAPLISTVVQAMVAVLLLLGDLGVYVMQNRKALAVSGGALP